MEHWEDSSLRTEHPLHLEIEMKLTPEEDSGPSLPLQPSCNQVCAFSDREYISSPDEQSKSLTKLCGLIIFYVMFMAVEVVGGTKANSLAVLTDAAHLLSDIAGFSISLFTLWASSWDATSQHSFGFKRLEVLGALLSVQLIWVICGVLIYEAVDRILHKTARVDGKLMFAIAALGFIVNFIMVMWLGHDHGHGHSHCACTGKNQSHKADELCARTDEENITLVDHPQKDTKRLNINLQGAYLHVMADMIQSGGVMTAGLIIWAKPKWFAVDLVCTLIFSIFALGSTAPMLRDVFCILMERTPSDVDVASLEIGLKCMKGVHHVHDLHVWAITVGKTVLACHVIVEPGINPSELLLKIRDYCERTYSIHHVTVQIEQKV